MSTSTTVKQTRETLVEKTVAIAPKSVIIDEFLTFIDELFPIMSELFLQSRQYQELLIFLNRYGDSVFQELVNSFIQISNLNIKQVLKEFSNYRSNRTVR